MNRRNLRTLKRKKEGRRFRLVIFIPLFIVSVCLGIFFLVRHYVLLREIVFIGNSHLKNEELRSLIRIKENEGIFSVPGRTIYSSLRQSPWIKDAVIRKELSGRMLIKVTEGVPVAILSLSGVPYLVDKDGCVLEQMRDGTVLFLPVIKDIDPGKNAGTFMEAVKFVDVLHDKKILAYDGEVEITGQRPEDISLKVDKVVIKVGTGDYDKKLTRLEDIRDEIQKRNMVIDYIDLRFANKIIVKPVSTAGGEDVKAQDVKTADKAPARHENKKARKRKR